MELCNRSPKKVQPKNFTENNKFFSNTSLIHTILLPFSLNFWGGKSKWPEALILKTTHNANVLVT